MKVFDNTRGSSQDKIMHNLLQKKNLPCNQSLKETSEFGLNSSWFCTTELGVWKLYFLIFQLMKF